MSTTLPHGIIQINEGNISWYGDITANWQLIDSKIGIYDAAVASIPAPANTGTLTINYGGTTLAMFGADDAGNATADIPAPGDGTLTVTYGGSTLGSFSANQATPETIDIPAPGDGTLTIQQNGVNVQAFTANASTNATANIQCVDLTSAQTIGGIKTFNENVKIQGSYNGNEFSTNARTVLEFRANRDTPDKSGIYVSKFRQNRAQGEMGGNDSQILTLDVLENEVRTNDLLRFTFTGWVNDVPTMMYLVPPANTLNIQSFLGTSSRAWADCNTNAINGINPGALSLPGTSVNVDTTNWVLDGSNVNIFTPTSDGWLGIQATDTVYDQMHYAFVGRNDSASYYQQNVLSPINALWDGEYHGCVFIPVIKNVGYDIRCICSSIIAKFYPCQGNV